MKTFIPCGFVSFTFRKSLIDAHQDVHQDSCLDNLGDKWLTIRWELKERNLNTKLSTGYNGLYLIISSCKDDGKYVKY